MKTGARTTIGAVAWLAFFASSHSAPSGPRWTLVLLTLAALVLVPLALDLVAERRDTGRIGRTMDWARNAQLPAATLLAIACGLRPGVWALLAAIPWAAFTVLLLSVGASRMLRDGWSRPLDRLGADIGMIYTAAGGIWLLADRAGLRLLGFEPDVVALTAVHFHHAGLLLPIAAGMVSRQFPDSRFAARAVVGVILGVPALAVGMTTTHFGWTPAVEAAAGCGLALGGLAVAILHVRWAVDTATAPVIPRVLVGVAGVALFLAMLLGAAYAIRPFAAPLPWLDPSRMRAIHGTLSALGFGVCAMLGWRMAVVRSE